MNIRRIAPGLALCVAIGLAGWILQQIEQSIFGRPYVEGLVIAILIGAVIASAWSIPRGLSAGIDFSAKPVLELAVCLIGVAIDTQLLRSTGLYLFAGIVAIVAVSLVATYGVGRAFGLPHRLAILVAAGNSICGNSAIAAVAPVIGAEPEDVASAISFTAVLGVVVVLILPLLATSLALTPSRYGIIAGLTVYAVPQVLAATLPIGPAAGAMGTLVKLVRVLLLGPVVIGLGLMEHRTGTTRKAKLVPWFIIGFIVMATIRSLGILSAEWIDGIRLAATILTLVAMAALGLGVDFRTLKKSSGRVVAVVAVSLMMLCGMSVMLARTVG